MSRPRIRYRTPSLHLSVLNQLRNMIIEGELAPREHLVETSLCEKLQVSRTPLGEALKILATEGLVEFSPHRGARVTELTAGEARELYETIAGIESLAAELATQRMPASAVEELDLLHEEMREHFKNGQRQEYFSLNNKIHEKIIEEAANSILASTHERLMYRARRGRYLAILSLDRWSMALEEHEEIMAAFHSRSPSTAAAVWRRHLINTGKELERQLSAGAPQRS